ncbi:hypothetical protein PoB_002813400 [Plakobranchus ocellatus]|uniref:Caspase family p20 domain-containing protein n=1 Tax=Plakobranchus ocellatus TaxID=259542 RepID=A0AAV4A4W9_9GAST|nr:hypothetical protein PoB_002813400 [Plakobranchus ocellatus]
MFQNVVEDNLDSAHIFLIVRCYGERFTEEDQAKTCGQGSGTEHAVVVLSYGDNFVRNTEDDNLTFSQWCENQSGALADLWTRCEKWALSADNRALDGRFKDYVGADK